MTNDLLPDKEDLCWNCKWLEDRSDGKFVNSGRCGLYGYGLEYTHFGFKKYENYRDRSIGKQSAVEPPSL